MQNFKLTTSSIPKTSLMFKLNNFKTKSEKALPYLGVILDIALSFLPYMRQKKEAMNLIQKLLRFSSVDEEFKCIVSFYNGEKTFLCSIGLA